MPVNKILKDNGLSYVIDQDKSELTIKMGNSIFMEAELIAEDYDLIKKGELKKVLIEAFRIQIEGDLEAIEQEIDDDVLSVIQYTQKCFSIYNQLLNCP